MSYWPIHEYWDLFFKDYEILKLAREKFIYFTLLRGDRSYALVVTKRGTSQLNLKCWSSFITALQRPNCIDEIKGEIYFPKSEKTLNIQNLLYTNSYPNHVFGRHLWQSIWYPDVSTYGDSFRQRQTQHPRARNFGGSKYQLVFLVAGETRQVNVVPSVMETWPHGSRAASKRGLRLPVEVMNHVADYLLPLERCNLMATCRHPPLAEEQMASSRLWARVLRWTPWIERAKAEGVDLLLLGPDIGIIGDNIGYKPYVLLFTFPTKDLPMPWFGDNGLQKAIKGSKHPKREEEHDLPDMVLNSGGIFDYAREVRLPADQLETWLEKDIFSLYYSSPGVSKVEVGVVDGLWGCGTDFFVRLRDRQHAHFHCPKKRP